MNRTSVMFAAFFSVILLLSVATSVSNAQQIEPVTISSSDPEPFYVGVTYCGDSVQEAKQLIDKVKDYTNLFVLQSGSLQYGHRLDELRQIIDYTVDSNLYFIVYFSQNSEFLDDWFEIFDPRWDNYFLGIYFGDEPGGKMLDDYTSFNRGSSPHLIEKWIDGSVKVDFVIPFSKFDYDPKITYYSNGTIFVEKLEFNGSLRIICATYHTNGTISVGIREGFGAPSIPDENKNNIPYSHEAVKNMYPFGSYHEAADLFIDLYRSILTNETKEYGNVTYFTSDYALHWFDYKAGYDVIFAQLGWNHTLAQDIALVRGAANIQNKSWGAIITWKYTQPPYLDTGTAIYEQMRTAYESGAKYAVVFNYAENMTGPYGILQEEQFVALESFWNEVVQNPEVKQGSIKGEAVLVLPENYGWGMRSLNDTIWGLWDADEKSEQAWNLRSSLIEEYGLNLDIVYDDSEFPVEGKYSQTFDISTEKTEPFPTVWILGILGILVAAGAAFLVFFKKTKKTNGEVKI